MALKQRIVSQLVPQAYLNMDRILEQEKGQERVLSWATYEKLAHRVHIVEKDEYVISRFPFGFSSC